MNRLNRGETVASVEEILTKEDEQVEFFILGMRCMKGVSLENTGIDLERMPLPDMEKPFRKSAIGGLLPGRKTGFF